MTLAIYRGNVRVDAGDLMNYLPQLSALLADQSQLMVELPNHRKVSGSPAPWNSIIGELIMDIHAGSRRLADQLDQLTGSHRQARGSSAVGTTRALDRVAVRVEQIRRGGHPSAELAATDAARQLGIWAWRCRQELGQLHDDEQPWTLAPSSIGKLRCPNPINDKVRQLGVCNAALWLAPGWERDYLPPIFCRSTYCTDEHGQPHCWPFEVWWPIAWPGELLPPQAPPTLGGT